MANTISDFEAFLREETVTPISEDGPPTRCPYCGGTDITELDQWAAVSEDGESNGTLVEWHCVNACGGRAFWV